jgi:hypothetical protein
MNVRSTLSDSPMVYMWSVQTTHAAPIRTIGNALKVRSDIPISLFIFIPGKRPPQFAASSFSLTSPTASCRRNNLPKIFRRIAGGSRRSGRRGKHSPER